MLFTSRNRSNSIKLAFAGLIAALAIGSSVLVAENQKQNSPAVRQKTFDFVWKTINNNYFDPKFGGFDWVAIRNRYAPQVTSVKTDEELHELLDKMVQELGVSHLRVISWDALAK